MAKRTKDDEILTLTEIAGYLKVSEKTILRMLQDGRFPGVKISNQWRFVRAIVDDWLSARMQSASKANLIEVVGTGIPIVPLTRLISDRRILLHLQPGERQDVLAQLVAPLVEDGLVRDGNKYIARLAAREEVVSTAIGHGVAMPHVREPKDAPVATPCIVLGICREGTDFDALDGEKTRLFAMPCADSESVHLRLLARISLLLRRPGVLDLLTKAETKKDVTEVLADTDCELAGKPLSKEQTII